MGTPTFGGGGVKREREMNVGWYGAEMPAETSLVFFEQCARDRQAVLQGIERAYAQGLKSDEMQAAIEKLLGHYLPERHRDEAQLAEDRRKDYLSRHLLCLMYSRTADLHRWLLQQEDRLFKHRFNAMGMDNRAKVICELGAACKNITQDEYEAMQGGLMAVFGGRNMNMQEDSYSTKNPQYFSKVKEPWQYIYELPFEKVSALVKGRKVLLRRGNAYVLSRDLDAYASFHFSKRLSHELKRNQERFYSIVFEEKERLGPLLMSIPDGYVHPTFEGEGGVALKDLAARMAASAPLCMWNPYNKLTSRTERTHLKDFARIQLNLFLKGIGVKLEEVLVFWKREFMIGGINGEKFDREYAYNFKHQYGETGSRIKYKPFCCQHLIHSSPVTDSSCTAGCAYKHYKPADLKNALNGMRLKTEVVTAVMNKAKEGQYQLACTMVYEARHAAGAKKEGVEHAAGAKKEATKACVEHPNQYFRDSREYYEAKDSKDKENKNAAQQEGV
jgi:DNA primase large subunit